MIPVNFFLILRKIIQQDNTYTRSLSREMFLLFLSPPLVSRTYLYRNTHEMWPAKSGKKMSLLELSQGFPVEIFAPSKSVVKLPFFNRRERFDRVGDVRQSLFSLAAFCFYWWGSLNYKRKWLHCTTPTTWTTKKREFGFKQIFSQQVAKLALIQKFVAVNRKSIPGVVW